MVILWALLAVGSAQEQGLEVLETIFPSGLRVSAMIEPTSQVVGARVIIDAGEVRDPEGHPQLAHLVEHLWFRSRPGGGAEVQHRLAAAGCESNAHTSADQVSYELACPADAQSEMLTLAGALLTDPLAGITPAVIEQEVRVVRAELIGRRAHGAQSVYDTVFERIHPADHPYGRVTNDPARVAFDPTVAATFVRDSYTAGHATVVLTGAFTDAVRAFDTVFTTMRARAFDPGAGDGPVTVWNTPDGTVHWPADRTRPGEMLATDTPVRRIRPPSQFRALPGKIVTVPRSPEAAIAVAWVLPPALDMADGFSAWSLGDVLETSYSAALPEALVTDTSCTVEMLPEEVLVLCELTPADDVPSDKIISWLGQAPQIRLPWMAELTEALRSAAGKRWLDGELEDVVHPSGWRLGPYADFLHQGGQGNLLGTTQTFIATGQLWGGARAYLTKNLPKTTPWIFDFQEGTQADLRVRMETPVEHPPTPAPTASSAKAMAWPAADHASILLESGLQIVALRTGSQSLVDVTLFGARGLARSDLAVSSLAHWAMMFYPRMSGGDGTERWSAGFRGSYPQIRLSAPTGWLPKQLKAMVTSANTLDLDPGVFDTLRTKWARRREAYVADGLAGWCNATAAALPALGAASACLGDDALRGYLKVSTTAVRSQLRSAWTPATGLLVITGDIVPSEAVALAATTFASWSVPDKDRATSAFLPVASPSPSMVAFVDEDSPLVNLQLTCVAAGTRPTPWQADILGDVLFSAAYRTLRESEGLTYTPQVSAERVDDHLVLSVGAALPPTEATRGLAALNALLDATIAGQLPATELASATYSRVRRVPLERRTRDAAGYSLAGAYFAGAGVDAWLDGTYLGSPLTPELAASLAKGCRDQLLIEVSGPATAVDALETAAGLPVVRFQPEDAGDAPKKR